MTISPERAITTSSPLVLLTYRIVLLKPITPLDLASTLEAMTAREAAPPMWKVRMVSCVPGSPIDWAAITPTASPRVVSPPRAPAPPKHFGHPPHPPPPRRFQFFDQVFIEHHADRHQHHAVFRVQHFFGSGAPEDPVTQRFDHFAA